MTDTDRIEAVAQALYGGRRWAEQLPQQVSYWRTMGEVAVAALDAYDREHDPLHLAGMATIERDLRERIAADIEAERDRIRLGGADYAARIARGGQS